LENLEISVEKFKRPAVLRPLPAQPTGKLPAAQSNTTREEFESIVAQAKELIAAGDIFQVVLSQRFETEFTGDPLDLYRCLQFGSVQVTEQMVIERYSHVMHIVSHVIARLRDDKNAFDVIRATFPAGTVSGAPKIRAMQIIADLEKSRRGFYAGIVGYFGFDGSHDSCIAIRSIV